VKSLISCSSKVVLCHTRRNISDFVIIFCYAKLEMLFETMFLIPIIMINCGCFMEQGFIFLSVSNRQLASFYKSISSVQASQERSAPRDEGYLRF